MNDILSIKVDGTIEHGMHAKKCAATYTEILRNEWNLGLRIISVCPIFDTHRKAHGYANLTRLSSGIWPQGSNGAPVVCLINDLFVSPTVDI